MITCFSAAPTETIGSIIAPVVPIGWRREREGDTGWWTIYGPGVPSDQTRILLYDTRVSVTGLRLFQATVQSLPALALLQGLLSAVPWWATVLELRAWRDTAVLPTGRDETWGTRATSAISGWRDERPTGDTGEVIRVYRTVSGYDARADAETTTREQVLAAIGG